MFPVKPHELNAQVRRQLVNPLLQIVNRISAQCRTPLFDLAFKRNLQTFIEHVDRVVVIVDVATELQHFFGGVLDGLIR